MKGYIHCDLKPENIMIGDFEFDDKLKKNIYLIDFGMSERYLDDNGHHVPFRENIPFKGNLVFSSWNTFKNVTLSRRDDLIMLIYNLIFFVDSDIAWINRNKSIHN